MKKLVMVFTLISLITATAFAQEPTKMRPKDRLIITAHSDIWSGLPTGMKQQAINRGITIDNVQEFPISTSNFSVAAGVGFSSHNLYSNHVYFDKEQNGNHEFMPVGEIYSNEYSNNKISLNYVNIPLEIRYRTRNTPKTFRVHAGLKAGLLVSGHTKYVGEINPGGRKTKLKEKMLENTEPYLIGLYGRIGYGRVNLHGYMSLTDIFSNNNAQEASFLSLGLSFIVF
jgi:hypothetical protein